MHAHLVVTMPDGSLWSVPVEVIARSRAEWYAKEYDGTFEERVELSLKNDTLPLFESDTYEIHDWAANNMNWEDVASHATRLSGPSPVDYQDGWCNGAWKVE